MSNVHPHPDAFAASRVFTVATATTTGTLEGSISLP
jgi:hypothetical protein